MSWYRAALAILCEALATASAATIPILLSRQSRFLGPVQVTIERAAKVGGGTIWGVDLPGPPNSNRQDFLTDGATTTWQTTIPYAALANNNWIVSLEKSQRTGTVSSTLGSRTITGSGTAFTTELVIGDTINFNGETHSVTAIASDTSLTISEGAAATAATQILFMLNGLLKPTTDFTVSSVGGFALITLGAATKGALNSRMSVMFVAPVSLLTFTDGTLQFHKEEIQGYQVMWFVADATATPSATNIYLNAIGS